MPNLEKLPYIAEKVIGLALFFRVDLRFIAIMLHEKNELKMADIPNSKVCNQCLYLLENSNPAREKRNYKYKLCD
ncbi:hypothetical protein BB560_001587 [Smittium megazygosporum]|uniref:Uncharacterized protein n=1 Tax=Smittium megazygosporum TaxID=133381 RepID=A0A2T9ZH95_9FUNG|nr:hypothetical protein BB560_001587 [Smittium megazygosporum]